MNSSHTLAVSLWAAAPNWGSYMNTKLKFKQLHVQVRILHINRTIHQQEYHASNAVEKYGLVVLCRWHMWYIYEGEDNRKMCGTLRTHPHKSCCRKMAETNTSKDR
jgi:hypothetical protein